VSEAGRVPQESRPVGRAVLRRVSVDPEATPGVAGWCRAIPAIAQLIEDGVDLDPRVTVVVGENGSGKSTFVEAVAQRWGTRLTAAVHHWGPASAPEDADLYRALVLHAPEPRPQGGCFLRAEAMHGLFRRIDDGPQTRAFGGQLNVRSHGESFLAYLQSRLDERGLFVLDEPEAALSFTSCLRLLNLLDVVVSGGSQVLLATHSPLLAAFPGATILEFGEHGIRTEPWAELDLVEHWTQFLQRPQSYLRHLFDDG
jgi:predicted ATPase